METGVPQFGGGWMVQLLDAGQNSVQKLDTVHVRVRLPAPPKERTSWTGALLHFLISCPQTAYPRA